jgi:hypothetical protein
VDNTERFPSVGINNSRFLRRIHLPPATMFTRQAVSATNNGGETCSICGTSLGGGRWPEFPEFPGKREKYKGISNYSPASNAPYNRRICWRHLSPPANIGRRLNATRTGNFGAGSGNIGPQNAELRNGNGTRTHLINPFTPDSWS